MISKWLRMSQGLLIGTATIGLSITASAQQGWSQIHSIRQGNKAATLNSIFYDGEQVWIVGADGLILRSNDHGSTFEEVDSRIDVGLNDVFVLKEKVWVVGDHGTMLFSTDSGRSFVKNLYTAYGRGKARNRQRADGPGGALPKEHLDLYSVQFVDLDRGYIVGDGGLILASTDGGVTWREQASGTDAQLFHLSFRAKRGWVVGTGGVVLHTDNGGKNWYPQSSGTSADLNRVLMISDEVGFISGDKGTLLRTENAGATWVKVPLRTSQSLFGISFVNKKTGWVVGYTGVIIRTYDGGRNWVEQESQTTTDLFAVSFNKNRGFTIGREGIVLRYYERR